MPTLVFYDFGHSSSLQPLWNLLDQASMLLGNYPRVLYLFTRSDFKTIVLPVTIFAYLSNPDTSTDRMLYAIFWTWVHLLQFCISNQSLDPEEDALNKPWRPISSGLASAPSARTLRWILLPLCFSLSVCLEVPWQGISLALGFIAHNELGLHSHWLMRNICNALGYAFFNAGASAIAAGQSKMTTHRTSSFAINALIILSTIHAQDFRDEVGDKLRGRRTLPIVWPEESRILILLMLTAWAVGLSWACGLAPLFSVPFCALAFFTGLRFFCMRTAEADRVSYRYYNIWLTAAQVVHISVTATTLSRS